MIHSQTYRSQGRELLGRVVPVLLVIALIAVLLLTIVPLAVATGSSSQGVPQAGQVPVPNAGWQAEQIGREPAWWQAGRNPGAQPSTTAPQPGPWVPWPGWQGR